MRAGLVGSATALATPLFPVIGLNQLVFRYLTPQQRLVLAGGSSMAYFSAMVLSPKLFWYAPLLLRRVILPRMRNTRITRQITG